MNMQFSDDEIDEKIVLRKMSEMSKCKIASTMKHFGDKPIGEYNDNTPHDANKFSNNEIGDTYKSSIDEKNHNILRRQEIAQKLSQLIGDADYGFSVNIIATHEFRNGEKNSHLTESFESNSVYKYIEDIDVYNSIKHIVNQKITDYIARNYENIQIVLNVYINENKMIADECYDYTLESIF